jgi:hypothetical protein
VAVTLSNSVGVCLADAEYIWGVLLPDNDSRPADVQEQDRYDSTALVSSMNDNVDCFRHRLIRRELAIRNLLGSSSCFCELHFDAVHPLLLTDEEKAIIKEFFKRGGFILFIEDCYPYSQDEFWGVRSWPIIDFIKEELPSQDHDFSLSHVSDSHAIFHTYYTTQTADAIWHELNGNPYTPNRTLLSYRGTACAFVYGRYGWLEDDQWIADQRPFKRIFSMQQKSYELTVNLYVYATSH